MISDAPERNAEATAFPLMKKASIGEALTSTPMGYLVTGKCLGDSMSVENSPKWLPFSGGTVLIYSVDSKLVEDFISPDKGSLKSSNSSFFLTAETLGEESQDVEQAISSHFQLVFEVASADNSEIIVSRISVEIDQYIRSGNRTWVDLTAEENTGRLLLTSGNLSLSINLISAGVTARLPVIPIQSDIICGQNQMQYVTLRLIQKDIIITFDSATLPDGELQLHLTCLAMSIETLDELLSRRFALLNLSQELNSIRSVTDIHGIIEELSSTNLGSRTVQRLLMGASLEEIDFLLEMLTDKLPKLAVDAYGNYVFQKLLQSCSLNRRMAAVSSLVHHLPAILQTKTGTHAMQALLMTASCFEEIQLYLYGISGHELLLCCNQQSTHFMQKLLGFPLAALYQTVFQSLEELAQNQFGVVVVRAFMEITALTEWRLHILHKLQLGLPRLIQHEFAHYLIQIAFELYGEQECWTIRQMVLTELTLYSCNTFSSGVIEKMLAQFCCGFSGEVLERLETDQECFLRLLDNKSGSYVMHRLLDCLSGAHRSRLDALINVNIPRIGNYQNRNKWSKYYGKGNR